MKNENIYKRQRMYKLAFSHLVELLIILVSGLLVFESIQIENILLLFLGHFIFRWLTRLNRVMNYYFNKSDYIKIFLYSILITSLNFFISNERELKNHITVMLLITFLQILYREFILKIRFNLEKVKSRRNVLIIGAGNAGEQIIREIKERSTNFNIIGILDDSEQKQRKNLYGVSVIGKINSLGFQLEKYQVDQVLICIPSADSKELDLIFKECINNKVAPKVLPDSFHVLENQVRITQFREIDIEDILTRKKVSHDTESIQEFLKNKHVLVTGGAGSIGSELCFQAIKMNCQELTIVDNNEYSLYTIDLKLKELFPNMKINTKLQDVRNFERINDLIRQAKPDIVYHAAAYKHVPLVENNPLEAIENNILGTSNLLKAVKENDVKQFVLVSTDKAVNPTNIMGATKRLCEILTLKMDSPNTKKTIVRFGNVLNSNGSVVPRFEEQIKNGGPLTLTHKDIIRYFMSIPEAAQLLLLSATLERNNQIFVLDMGNPVKIQDLAEKLIRIHGLVPNEDIKIIYTGLRPGEKLYEELLADNETTIPTGIEKIRSAKLVDVNDVDSNEIDIFLKDAETMNTEELKSILRKFIPEYSPAS